MSEEGEELTARGTWTAGIHPQSIPGALKVQQDAVTKLQRVLRQELAKLQAEETILKLMVRRERRRLARKAANKHQELHEQLERQQRELQQQQL